MTSMEALEELMDNYQKLCEDVRDNDIQYQLYNLTSPYYTIYRDLEALEIIREKDVSIALIKSTKTGMEYNSHVIGLGTITEEEYSLVKRCVEKK